MKKWTFRLFVLLILGAVTTVAVAWGIALWTDTPLGGSEGERTEHDRRVWDRSAPSHWPRAQGAQTGTAEFTSRARSLRLLTVLDDETAPPDVYQLGHELIGWPRFALAWVYFDSPDGTWYRWSLPSDPEIDYMYRHEQMVPLQPIWPGFLIDTLFYAAIWFGVFFGFASARSAIRRRRGRCPKCGYDLRGHMSEVRGQMSEISKGCPECGWRRTEEGAST